MTPPADQQQRLHTFGARAASSTDVNALLTLACREIAASLGISHVKALEYLQDQNALLIRAGVGWADHVVGEVLIPAGAESAAGYTLQTGMPTTCNDLEAEHRFLIPQLYRDHGVRSMANVLIMSGDEIFGVLEADNNRPRAFGDDDIKLLQSFANILALVISQAHLARQKRELLEHQELLLKEISHRTKNNNQVLMSIIEIKKKKARTDDARKELNGIQNRIMLLSSIDDVLATSNYEDRVDAGVFVSRICGDVCAAISSTRNRRDLRLDLEKGTFSRSQAQAVAIIINEFITNSVKHAHKDAGLAITLRLGREGTVMDLLDGGPGIPDKVDRGLGMNIIDAAANRIGAVTRWIPGGGAHLRLELPDDR
ncbi:MAG: GAF domain-containing protein [Rhodospirillales bacterium]|nr:GAF domain-containing protein [Rhodospirillales bacterium]